MIHKLANVSMNGRMAYTIMCVEAFLANQYPDRDWRLIAEKMWAAATTDWGDWPMMYSRYLPDIIFDDDNYDREYFGPYMSSKSSGNSKAFTPA